MTSTKTPTMFQLVEQVRALGGSKVVIGRNPDNRYGWRASALFEGSWVGGFGDTREDALVALAHEITPAFNDDDGFDYEEEDAERYAYAYNNHGMGTGS